MRRRIICLHNFELYCKNSEVTSYTKVSAKELHIHIGRIAYKGDLVYSNYIA